MALSLVELEAARMCPRIHVYSPADRTALERLGIKATAIGLMPERFSIMPRPVDRNHRDPVGPRLLIIGNQDVAHVRAGTEQFLKAVSGSKELLNQIGGKILIAGVGATRPSASVFQEDFVVYREWLPDLDAAFKAVDLVIIPDVSGSGPRNRTLQVLQAGVPVAGFADAFEGLPDLLGGSRIKFADEGDIVPVLTNFFLDYSASSGGADDEATQSLVFEDLRRKQTLAWREFLEIG